jgi:hypothetical protein
MYSIQVTNTNIKRDNLIDCIFGDESKKFYISEIKKGKIYLTSDVGSIRRLWSTENGCLNFINQILRISKAYNGIEICYEGQSLFINASDYFKIGAVKLKK